MSDARQPSRPARSRAFAPPSPQAAAIVSICVLLWSCHVPDERQPEQTTSPETSPEMQAGPERRPSPRTDVPAFPSPTSPTDWTGEAPVAPAESPAESSPDESGAAADPDIASLLAETELLSARTSAPGAASSLKEDPSPDAILAELDGAKNPAEPSVGSAHAPPASPGGTPSPAGSGLDVRKAMDVVAGLSVAPGAEAPAPAASPEPSPAVAAKPADPAPAAKPEEPEEPAAAPGSDPAAASPPASADSGAAAAAAPAAPEPPKGLLTIKELYHKTSDEFMRFARDACPEWVAKGHVARIEGKLSSILIRGETPVAEDPLTLKIVRLMDEFDDLELKVESRKIRPRYVNVATVIDTLTMRGLANVWRVTETTNTLTWKNGDKQQTASSKDLLYAKTGLVPGAVAPITVPPRIPYVYEVISSDPFELPLQYGGSANTNQPLVDFRSTSSTEERGAIVAVGTPRDIEAIQAFIDELDKPARQILIEVEVIQLEASKLTDLGIDSIQFGERHTIVNQSNNLAGETVTQPGFGEALRRPNVQTIPITEEGFSLIFDDSSQDLAGRFMGNLHALVRTGDAQFRARPKILTLDDRQSIIHIGQNVPVFKSTGVTRDSTVGSYVSQVNNVDAIYVGFSLNIRPRISGGAEDEVSLQIEVSVNELGDRQRVFAEDLLGIPNIFKRQYIGQNRVKNHRPIVLGGLISEKESESVSQIPLLGDIPYLGWFFRRTVTNNERQEVVFVLTPHILSEKGWDRFAAPKESSLYDTYDSVLFNDSHIIKGSDVIGVDPISGTPSRNEEGRLFTEEEVVDLTLLNIVKERELVSKLGIIQDYVHEGSSELNWIQRRWPESTLKSWPEEKQLIYFRAAAIVIDNIKELNPDLTYEEIVLPRREIILPTTPYRITLSYDRVKTLQAQGLSEVFRGRTELTEKTIQLLRDASVRSLRQFADYLESMHRSEQDHAELLAELKELYVTQNPTQNDLEGIPYPEVWRKLDAAKLDFASLATFFVARKRARVDYNIDVGELEKDLQDFLAVSLSLPERAKWLMDLDRKWDELNLPKEARTLPSEEPRP